jgi:hypothetical protein
MRSLACALLVAVACSGEAEPEGPPHTCEGYLVEVRTDDIVGQELADELNGALFAGSVVCMPDINGRVLCGSACSGTDWQREEAMLEADRIRVYLETNHPDLLLRPGNPQVLDCACRIY